MILVGTNPTRTPEVEMLGVMFIVLLAASVAAPFLGTNTSDSRSESAHPTQGWFPAL
ncbi:MAG: hypothetical protein M0Z98_04925 [Actinomycetales bacterium]|nr:hypothetical protein [Actinomycetales bacterium]